MRARDEFLDLKITRRGICRDCAFLGENEEIIIARRRFARESSKQIIPIVWTIKIEKTIQHNLCNRGASLGFLRRHLNIKICNLIVMSYIVTDTIHRSSILTGRIMNFDIN